jgi:hypothetical protein
MRTTELQGRGIGSHSEAAQQARRLLNQGGTRIMSIDGELMIGVWADRDCPELRAALRACQADIWPVRYLDGSCVPPQYKLRQVPGEPVPRDVLDPMERCASEPWVARDRMLRAMGWRGGRSQTERLVAIDLVGGTTAALNRSPFQMDATGDPGNRGGKKP